MTKLTKQEIDKEIEAFNKWHNKALLERKISKYNPLIMSWLARAELAKVE